MGRQPAEQQPRCCPRRLDAAWASLLAGPTRQVGPLRPASETTACRDERVSRQSTVGSYRTLRTIWLEDTGLPEEPTLYLREVQYRTGKVAGRILLSTLQPYRRSARGDRLGIPTSIQYRYHSSCTFRADAAHPASSPLLRIGYSCIPGTSTSTWIIKEEPPVRKGTSTVLVLQPPPRKHAQLDGCARGLS